MKFLALALAVLGYVHASNIPDTGISNSYASAVNFPGKVGVSMAGTGSFAKGDGGMAAGAGVTAGASFGGKTFSISDGTTFSIGSKNGVADANVNLVSANNPKGEVKSGASSDATVAKGNDAVSVGSGADATAARNGATANTNTDAATSNGGHGTNIGVSNAGAVATNIERNGNVNQAVAQSDATAIQKNRGASAASTSSSAHAGRNMRRFY